MAAVAGRRGTPALPEPNPALVRNAQARAQSLQNRVADRITAFAGSMWFVYIHIAWFSCWIGFGVERYPYGLLTMIVSLEAIFLSTFVMISQNRADAKRQAIADQQWATVKHEDRQNEELLALSRRILELTEANSWLGRRRPLGDAVRGELPGEEPAEDNDPDEADDRRDEARVGTVGCPESVTRPEPGRDSKRN